jgi:hypothetical protein
VEKAVGDRGAGDSAGSDGGDSGAAARCAHPWKSSSIFACTYKTVCPEVTICAENNSQDTTIQHVPVKGSEMIRTSRPVLTESAMTNSTVGGLNVQKTTKNDGF